MAASLLKRRLNPFLLISTVVVLSLLAGLSVLYQSQLNDLVTSKKNLKQLLEEKRDQVNRLQVEKENLTRKIKSMNRSISNLKSQLTSIKSRLSSKNSTVKELRTKIDTKDEKIQNLTQEIEGQDQRTANMSEALNYICSNGNLTDKGNEKCDNLGY